MMIILRNFIMFSQGCSKSRWAEFTGNTSLDCTEESVLSYKRLVLSVLSLCIQIVFISFLVLHKIIMYFNNMLLNNSFMSLFIIAWVPLRYNASIHIAQEFSTIPFQMFMIYVNAAINHFYLLHMTTFFSELQRLCSKVIYTNLKVQ